MNKTELVKATAAKAGKTIKETGEIVAALQETIMETLKAGEDVKVVGFGNLEVQDVPEGERRNPATGEKFIAKANKTVKAKLAKAVKDAAR